MNLSNFSQIYQNILNQELKNKESSVKVDSQCDNKEVVKEIPYTSTVSFAKVRM